MAYEIHVGDIGTIFKVTITDEDGVALDISAATTKQIIFKKPNKELLTATADFVTDGTDGQIQYSTVSGDLDRPGNWRIQGKIIEPTRTNYSDIDDFRVHPNN